MKRTFVFLSALVTLSLATFAFTTSAPEATCTGSKSCRACKNCKYCKHCAKQGGSCGVCK